MKKKLKLSDIKFDENIVITIDMIEQMVKQTEINAKELDYNRKISDYNKLYRQMDI